MRLNERAKRAKQARRTNARKSSGPKTEAGKLRVSRNALTHGLSIPIGLLPNSRAAIERLAHIILESINLSKNDPTAWYAACSFSEAHLDVERIRSLRSQALSRSIIQLIIPTQKDFRKLLSAAKRIEDDDEEADFVIEYSGERFVESNPPLPEKYRLIASLLQRLDRYERRALSRRKKALRLLSDLQRTGPNTGLDPKSFE